MYFLCHKILVLYSTCALTPSVQTSEIGYQQQRMALWNSGSAVLVDHKLAIMHHFGQMPFSPGLYMLKQPVVSISGTTYLTKIDTQLLWGSLFQLSAMFRRYTNSANIVQFSSILTWRIEQINTPFLPFFLLLSEVTNYQTCVLTIGLNLQSLTCWGHRNSSFDSCSMQATTKLHNLSLVWTLDGDAPSC